MQQISATCENCVATNWCNMERQETLCRELRACGACLVQVVGAAFGLARLTMEMSRYDERNIIDTYRQTTTSPG